MVAFMMTVLLGFVGLAIDSGRAFTARRDMQGAADAAALKAADRYGTGQSWATAQSDAAKLFADNIQIYTLPACGGFAIPVPTTWPVEAPVTTNCTLSDGTAVTFTAIDQGPTGQTFRVSVQRSLTLAFIQALGLSPKITVKAASAATANDVSLYPTLGALSTSCPNGGAETQWPLGFFEFSRPHILGDVVADGGFYSSPGSREFVAGNAQVAPGSGSCPIPNEVNLTANFQCWPSGLAPPCGPGNMVGALRQGAGSQVYPGVADPGYPVPSAAGSLQGNPTTIVKLQPGIYSSNPNFGGGCYFLTPGQYTWQNGLTLNGGFVSNELKPPGEVGVPFWNTNGVRCAGDFSLTPVGGSFNAGTWGVELTSLRSDNGVQRESAPSQCKQINVNGTAVQIDISNVPGAHAYNVYAAQGGCGNTFGLITAAQIANGLDCSTAPWPTCESNGNTSGCPSMTDSASCTLGHVRITVDGGMLSGWNPPKPYGTNGGVPPDAETSPYAPAGSGYSPAPNQNPNRATYPSGDLANENFCSQGGTPTACATGNTTPGAVQFYLPGPNCINLTANGDTYVFGGYQYNWLLVFEPPGNACSSPALTPDPGIPDSYTGNNLVGAGFSGFIGAIYAPAAKIRVTTNDALRAPVTGGWLASWIQFQLGVNKDGSVNSSPGTEGYLVYSSGVSPVVPVSRLTG